MSDEQARERLSVDAKNMRKPQPC